MTRRPLLIGALGVAAAAVVLVLVQPLSTPYWTGSDADSTYVASGLRLFAGQPTKYYDHPGIPLQEAAAALFTASWAIDSHGDSRAEAARGWLWNIDSTRPYMRTLSSVFFLASALLVYLVVSAFFGSAWWGFLGGLLFLSLPDIIPSATISKPDKLLTALCVLAVALLVRYDRRGSPAAFLAAAAVAGYALSVKLLAIGLLPVFLLALAFRRPAEGWGGRLVEETRVRVKAHARLVGVATAVWLALLVLLNVGAATPNGRYVRDLVAGLAGAAVAGTAAWYAVRGTRLRTGAGLLLLAGAAYVVGLLVPNFFYASTPPTMVRWLWNELRGNDVNSHTHGPVISNLQVLRTWVPLVVVAAFGFARGALARDRTVLLWALGAVVTCGIALSKFPNLNYFDPSLALLIPLALAGLRGLRWRPALLAAAAVALVVLIPIRDGIRFSRDRGHAADQVEVLNRWVESHVGPGEVGLTSGESNDSRYFYLVRVFATGPEPPYRMLPTTTAAAAYIREHRWHVRYLIVGRQDGTALLASLGLPGHARPAPGRPGVQQVLGG